MRNLGNKRGSIALIVGILLIATITIITILAAVSFFSTYEVTSTVLAKHVDVSGGGDAGISSHYVVVLTDGRTLEVDRLFWDMEHAHNPDLIYAQLEINATYNFKCWGWQNEWFYWYPNVYEISRVVPTSGTISP